MTCVKLVVAAAMAGAWGAVAAELPATADFSVREGKIRPELFASGLGGQLTGPQRARLDETKALGLTAARTHDWALNNPGQRICDVHFVFPLLRADADDARNYFFAPTDEILKQTVETLGMNVMYRLGTSIECVNAGRTEDGPQPGFYNSVEPADWEQFAKACSHIIRHYTEGWANGFRWGERMKYWELWNEPNSRPGGSWINRDMNADWVANRIRFSEFYAFVLKRLKAEFPQLKFGGPALCNYDEIFLRKLLEICRARGYTPDFVSWHGYSDDPDAMLGTVPEMRRVCDAYGFKDMELIINEWHYIPYKKVWGDLDKGPEIYREACLGTNGLVSVEAGVYALQVFMGVQGSLLAQNYYYGCGQEYGNIWGIRLADGSLNKTYYALLAFGDMVRACADSVRTARTQSPVRVFGGLSADGRTAKLLVTDYRPAAETFEVGVKGLAGFGLKSVRLLDRDRDLTAGDDTVTATVDGYRFRHVVPGSAAWLLTFERKTK